MQRSAYALCPQKQHFGVFDVGGRHVKHHILSFFAVAQEQWHHWRHLLQETEGGRSLPIVHPAEQHVSIFLLKAAPREFEGIAFALPRFPGRWFLYVFMPTSGMLTHSLGEPFFFQRHFVYVRSCSTISHSIRPTRNGVEALLETTQNLTCTCVFVPTPFRVCPLEREIVLHDLTYTKWRWHKHTRSTRQIPGPLQLRANAISCWSDRV